MLVMQFTVNFFMTEYCALIFLNPIQLALYSYHNQLLSFHQQFALPWFNTLQ